MQLCNMNKLSILTCKQIDALLCYFYSRLNSISDLKVSALLNSTAYSVSNSIPMYRSIKLNLNIHRNCSICLYVRYKTFTYSPPDPNTFRRKQLSVQSLCRKCHRIVHILIFNPGLKKSNIVCKSCTWFMDRAGPFDTFVTCSSNDSIVRCIPATAMNLHAYSKIVSRDVSVHNERYMRAVSIL